MAEPPGSFARASNANPVVGEQNVLAGIDARHVTADAITPRLHGAWDADHNG